jgi:hypothetical protein
MILKVQRPLEASPDFQGDAPFFVYAEGRRFQTLVPRSKIPPVVLAAMRGAPKAYFDAQLQNGEWIFGQRVADQEW